MKFLVMILHGKAHKTWDFPCSYNMLKHNMVEVFGGRLGALILKNSEDTKNGLMQGIRPERIMSTAHV